jgi:multiple sugar transport system permease protein
MSTSAAAEHRPRLEPGAQPAWRSSASQRKLFGTCLLLPALAFALGMVVYPIARTLWMSVHNFNLSRPQRMHEFVGLGHYEALVREPHFWNSIGVTLSYSFAVTTLSYAIGLGLALLLNQRSIGTRIGRTLLSLPWALPGVVAAFTFLWMFDASFGVVNFVLLRIGLIDAPIAWLTSASTAMVVISLVGIWKIVPFTMLTQLAGLQAIPSELYQAAKVDGASRWQEFRNITWPALGHVRVVTIVLTGLVTFREFGQIYVISGGGPDRSTETLSVNLYVEAFQGFHFGYASALGIVMLAISLVFTILVVRLLRTDFH